MKGDVDKEKGKAQARKVSVKEAAASSLMDGFGNRYITPYALSVGAANIHIALISSLPNLLANFSQLVSLRLMKKHTRKRLVVFGVAFQAFMWIPLILAGLLYFLGIIGAGFAAVLIVALYTLLIFVGALASPAWSSWMKDILSANAGTFLSNRTKIYTGIVLLSSLTAGFILSYFEESSVFFGFALIFLVALIGRGVAALYFRKKYEPPFKSEEKYYFSFWQFISHMSENNFGRFVIFISLISLATAVASPFFAVYLLRDLGLNYFYFTLITISPIASTFAFLPAWGKFSDKYGNVKLLKITGALVPIVPLLWLAAPYFISISVESAVFYLFMVEVLSGLVWAGFNHGAATFIYEAVTREKMAYCAAYFNILNSSGVFVGALLGSFIASQNLRFFGLSSLLVVFLISGVLRLVIFLIMNRMIKEVKSVRAFSAKNVEDVLVRKGHMVSTHFWRAVGLTPIRIRQFMTH